jgi:hypothetical protein
MAAFGGKSVKGVLKEKKLVNRVRVRDMGWESTFALATAVSDLKKMKVDAAKKRPRMTSLGVRIFVEFGKLLWTIHKILSLLSFCLLTII